MIRSEEDASRAGYLLHAFRQLIANPAWTEEIAPKIDAALMEHTQGCTARNKTPTQRAEHIEAVHLAAELQGFCKKRIDALEGQLRDWQKKAGL